MRSARLVMVAMLVAAACHKGEKPPEKASARDEWHVQRGTAPFLIRGKLLTLRGMADQVSGDLDIDMADLTRTRGSISVDLASIAMTSFVDAEQNRRQTSDAKRWLEIDGGNRWAKFTVHEVASAEPRDLTSGVGSVRKSRVVARGEMSLHGHVAPMQVTLEASVSFEDGAPRYTLVRTVDDLHLDLASYEIRPRDEVGGLLAQATDLIRDKVGETADIAVTVALESKSSGAEGR